MVNELCTLHNAMKTMVNPPIDILTSAAIEEIHEATVCRANLLSGVSDPFLRSEFLVSMHYKH